MVNPSFDTDRYSPAPPALAPQWHVKQHCHRLSCKFLNRNNTNKDTWRRHLIRSPGTISVVENTPDNMPAAINCG